MAVHGVPRATVAIDLLIRPEDEPEVRGLARALGYTMSAEPMSFADGAVQIRRVSKFDHPFSEEMLLLDMILVGKELEEVWKDRVQLECEFGKLWVVSRSGLVRLKKLRGSAQDLEDIGRLTGEGRGNVD